MDTKIERFKRDSKILIAEMTFQMSEPSFLIAEVLFQFFFQRRYKIAESCKHHQILKET